MAGIIRRPGEARVIDIGAFSVTVLADAGDTNDGFAMIETSERGLDIGPPVHVHRDAVESFYVLDGAYVMVIEGRETLCTAGSFILVPRGVPHTFRSAAEGSRKLNLYTPAAMVGYFDDLAAGIAAGMAPADLDAIAGRYAMDVVGEIPDTYLVEDRPTGP